MRKAFRRKIWGLSLAGGVGLSGALLLAGFAQQYLSAYQELGEKNQRTLTNIHCKEGGDPTANDLTSGQTCDLTAIENDQEFERADYVLDPKSALLHLQQWALAEILVERLGRHFHPWLPRAKERVLRDR